MKLIKPILIRKKLITIILEKIIMNKIFSFSKKIKIPPTRGLRYKEQPYALVPKNSYKSPSIDKNSIPSFQTFTVMWNTDMTKFYLKDTTPINNLR